MSLSWPRAVLGGVLAERALGLFDLAEAAMFAAVPGGLLGSCAAALSLRLSRKRRTRIAETPRRT